jgi:Flp pilus assembly protein CpaB
LARSNLGGVTSRRPFTILGIILALLVVGAFVLVALTAGNGQQPQTESVVVASRALSPRIPIDASALQVKSIPTGGYPNEILYHKVSEVQGMVPLVTIEEGQAITTNLVAKPGAALGSQAAFLPIPSGYVAYTLPTSEQQGVGGYIAPDDYIAIIATVDVNAKIAAATVFTNVHVIRVGLAGSASGASGSQQIASSLTVVVTECQAEYLTWFLTYASLKYTLESYHDYAPNSTATADPNCASVTAAKGVNLTDVKNAYPQLFL